LQIKTILSIILDKNNIPHLFWTTSYNKVYEQYAGEGSKSEKATLTRHKLHYKKLTSFFE